MNKYAQKILNSLLSEPCPSGGIPRSGDEGKKINCYVLSLFEGSNPKLLIDSITDNGFSGTYWDDDIFVNETVVPFKYAENLDLRIEHYHGLVTHRYTGLFSFLINEWTWIYKLKSLYYLAKHRVPQFFFNRKDLQFPQRMKLLEKIIEKQASEPDKLLTSLGMMTYLYSARWNLHPNKTALKQKMDLYLKSFVESGELRSSGIAGIFSRYSITGKAITTLEEYQIETERAKDVKSIQHWMLVLTILLTIFAALQSGVFKAPVLIDFCLDWNWCVSHTE